MCLTTEFTLSIKDVLINQSVWFGLNNSDACQASVGQFCAQLYVCKNVAGTKETAAINTAKDDLNKS